jgi:hypothetical protein
MTLDELLAREAIRDLVARYNSYGDAGRFDSLWDLFADDIVMVITSRGGAQNTYEGIEQVRTIFTGARDRISAQSGSAPSSSIRHFTATHQIDLIDDTHAAGRCYFAVLMDGGLDHWGRYLDRYVCIDGSWRFAHRHVTIEGTSAGSWFAS